MLAQTFLGESKEVELNSIVGKPCPYCMSPLKQQDIIVTQVASKSYSS